MKYSNERLNYLFYYYYNIEYRHIIFTFFSFLITFNQNHKKKNGEILKRNISTGKETTCRPNLKLKLFVALNLPWNLLQTRQRIRHTKVTSRYGRIQILRYAATSKALFRGSLQTRWKFLGIWKLGVPSVRGWFIK